ncbi:MAG TPA: hypothetical protein H9735_11665 [Candidatus Anaerostipes excrementavium]|uniref:Uncharacterized protein n=1 Tax=Candidatus Anaerostipes excrementavium TaxID=2838463 RepID=A0A9D1WX53_9FIRM|nr:hypothetical protein [uncultured Anaerostipes sp.]HIX68762.1 hypothetical protein [Candidatus Anaerostipes excrementavium]
MDEEDFRYLIQRFIEQEQLNPETAERLLQQILKILFPRGEIKDRQDNRSQNDIVQKLPTLQKKESENEKNEML